MRGALLGLTCLALAACPAHTDSTPLIPVHPHPDIWGAVLGDRAASQARVHVMKDGEQLGGPSAVGRPGDLIVENEEVAFVIDQLGSSLGFAESGGNVVDAADATARKDELGQVFTFFGVFPRQGVYDTLSTGTSADGAAWVEAKGRELYEPKLLVSTRYTLHATDRALLVETTLENTGDKPVHLDAVGDAVQWGGAEKIAPGRERGFRGPSSGPFVGGVGRFVSYAMTSGEGTIDGVSGGSWTDTAVRKSVDLAASAKTTYARVLLVGERADTTSLIGELALAAGRPVGELQLTLSNPLGTGEAVQLFADGSQEALSLAAPFATHLPVGRYWASLSARPSVRVGPIDVNPGKPVRPKMDVEARAALELGCASARRELGPIGNPPPAVDRMPCKLTVEGTGVTHDPSFGPAYAAGAAMRQVTTAGEPARVLLPPGTYRVTASRGPEYAFDVADISVNWAEERSLWLSPVRVVDTSGYLACDFHQHTILGADAPTATRDRVVANAAEGVEVAVASEHNLVVSLEPLVRELGLERELVSLSGDELTSDANPHPWGHANVWPMPVDAGKPRGGAPGVRDRTARELFDAIQREPWARDSVLQVNHPRSGLTGYFDLMGFDPARGEGTDAGYGSSFDAVEVWNGRNVEARARVLEDWRALLRAGHPVTATADTDTHGVVGQEAGYPRTYVRVADDGHLDAWDAARSADLVRGVKTLRDVVLTDGPMLRVTANGTPIGGVARGRVLTVKVHVETAPWVEVDTVRVVRIRDGAAETTRNVRPVTPAAPPGKSGGARAADVELVLRFDADDAFFVVASGSKPMVPAMGRDPKSGDEMLPWAMTGAIWVDANGDGKSLGR
jgi:hypothetical protein